MTTEEKLKKIAETVISYAQRSADAIEERAVSRRNEELAAVQSEIDINEKNRLQQEIAAIDAGYSRELSRQMLESKRRIILKRDELADSVFEEISKKLDMYTGTKEYEQMLSSLIDTHKNVLSAGRGIMLVRAKDKPVIETILSQAGISVTVVSEPGIVLGGFRISISGRLIDETLDEKLAHKRREFADTSGFIID